PAFCLMYTSSSAIMTPQMRMTLPVVMRPPQSVRKSWRRLCAPVSIVRSAGIPAYSRGERGRNSYCDLQAALGAIHSQLRRVAAAIRVSDCGASLFHHQIDHEREQHEWENAAGASEYARGSRIVRSGRVLRIKRVARDSGCNRALPERRSGADEVNCAGLESRFERVHFLPQQQEQAQRTEREQSYIGIPAARSAAGGADARWKLEFQVDWRRAVDGLSGISEGQHSSCIGASGRVDGFHRERYALRSNADALPVIHSPKPIPSALPRIISTKTKITIRMMLPVRSSAPLGNIEETAC